MRGGRDFTGDPCKTSSSALRSPVFSCHDPERVGSRLVTRRRHKDTAKDALQQARAKTYLKLHTDDGTLPVPHIQHTADGTAAAGCNVTDIVTCSFVLWGCR